MALNWLELWEHELIQLKESGFEMEGLEEEFLSAQKAGGVTEDKCREWMARAKNAVPKADFPYDEPSDYEAIRLKCRPIEVDQTFAAGDPSAFDKIYGAWLGRSAGCLLGKPVEGWPRTAIVSMLHRHGAYPLDNYFSNRYAPGEVEPWMLEQYERNAIELCRAMPRDDDLDYTILALKTVEMFGRSFKTEDIAVMWLSYLPAYSTYTAERAAYLNVCAGVPVPLTATVNNPYREWIGAQIRADFYGYINPGNPLFAAEMAFRDAALSHVSNGIYGAMFVAAMTAAAFVETDVERLIKVGMSCIPASSRLYEAIEWTLALAQNEPDEERAVERLLEYVKPYHRVHTINNACIVALSLLIGRLDFEKTVTRAVMMGLDTDCNAATAGSIVGLVLGASRLPAKWVLPLHDRIESYISGEGTPAISGLAHRTVRLLQS